MNLIEWGIVGGVNEQNTLWICVCADDWTAESAIKVSNGGNGKYQYEVQADSQWMEYCRIQQWIKTA